MTRRRLSPPAIALRSPDEMQAIARVGDVLGSILDTGVDACVVGRTTLEVDSVVRGAIDETGGESLFDGYAPGRASPFRGVSCISVNEEVVHGVPGDRVIGEGDLVTLDVGIRLDGWCADVARTVLIGGGEMGVELRRRWDLIQAAESMLSLCVDLARPGVVWSEVGRAMEDACEVSGFGMVTEYVGHGIGRSLHEPPKVPAYASGFSGGDFTLEEGMVLAIEPILTLGRGPIPGDANVGRGVAGRGLVEWRMPVRVLEDGWTVVTADGSGACHVEWMVGIVDGGGRVLGR